MIQIVLKISGINENETIKAYADVFADIEYRGFNRLTESPVINKVNGIHIISQTFVGGSDGDYSLLHTTDDQEPQKVRRTLPRI